MASLKSASIMVFLFASLVSTAHAVQDHNSSRSNKSSSVAAPDETEKLLELAKEDALAVAKTMIGVDQKDGYNGRYKITVNVGVSVERLGEDDKRGR